MPLSRRELLKRSGAAAGALALPAPSHLRRPSDLPLLGPTADVVPPAGWDHPARTELLPFGHGVASGDPLADRVILWTRITIPDARGWDVADPQGITEVPVRWRMALDPGLVDVVAEGVVLTDATRDWTVKVDAGPLASDTVYFYAFDALGWRSPVGRTRTAPGPGDAVEELHLAHVACTSWWGDFFSAYARIGERDDLDLVVHVGDHVYEFCGGHPAVRAWRDRFDVDDLDARRWRTKAEARRRYALYYQDRNLMAAHLAAPWVIAVDNHDFADTPDEPVPAGADAATADRIRRYGGAEVFWEWTPTRPVVPDGSGTPMPAPGRDLQVTNPTGRDTHFTYKALPWGRLLTLVALSWDHLADEGEDDPADPAPSMLGARQWAWLKRTLVEHRDAAHRVILNQKNMGQLGNFTIPSDLVAAAESFGLPASQSQDLADIYPGWRGERRLLYRFLREEGIVDNVVLSGDSHGWWAYDLVEDSTAPDYNPVDPWAGTRITPVGVELVVGMGRPGLTDVAAEQAAEVALGGGAAHSAFGAGPAYHQVIRPPFIAPALAAEAAAMAANPNMAYMNWHEYGHTMVHLYPDRSVLELLASASDVDIPPGEGGGLLGGPGDTVLRRYESLVGRPHLRPLPLTERTTGAAKPAVPVPATVSSR